MKLKRIHKRFELYLKPSVTKNRLYVEYKDDMGNICALGYITKMGHCFFLSSYIYMHKFIAWKYYNGVVNTKGVNWNNSCYNIDENLIIYKDGKLEGMVERLFSK